MAFPATPLDNKTEIYINGSWEDISTYVYARDGISIKRGRQNEQSSVVETSTFNCTVDNRDGRFSPRNPAGPYYGYLGRNTKIRHSVPHTDSSFRIFGSSDRSSTPDSAATSVTGDLDLRIDLRMWDWQDLAPLMGKYITTGNQRSYVWTLEQGGGLKLWWSADGSAVLSATSTANVPIVTGRISLRVTIDVNNGAGGNTVTFYYSYDTNLSTATWTQLGSAVTQAGTTSIFNSTAATEIGEVTGANATYNVNFSYIYSAEIRNGIAGTVVANPSFKTQAFGTTSFADTASSPNTWTNQSDAIISNRDYRFWGEVASWPQEWDTTGSDVWGSIEASGYLRRLSQGSSPLRSAYYRGIIGRTDLVAYWPCEEGSDANFFGSAMTGSRAKPLVIAATPTLATYTGTFRGSSAIPEFNGSSWSGSVADYTFGSGIQFQFLLHVPSGGSVNNTCIARLFCSGSAGRWDIIYNTTGDITISVFNGLNTSIYTSGAIGFDIDGDDVMVSLDIVQNGSDVDYDISTLQPGQSSGLTAGDTVSTATIGRATGVHMNPPGSAGLQDVAIGHIAIYNSVQSIFALDDQLVAWNGEIAGVRMQRLMNEEGVNNLDIGGYLSGQQCGYQTADDFINLLSSTAEADGGILYEGRVSFSLAYRPKAAIYNQRTAATLDYAQNQMQFMTPTEDDKFIRNDVTVTRKGGGSTRKTLTSGNLSTLDPPDGVGPYSDAAELILYQDEQTPHQANWRLYQGTIDQPRITQLAVRLEAPEFVANSTLAQSVSDIEVGDRVKITNPPTWVSYDTLDLLVSGYTEECNAFERFFIFNCAPFQGYNVGQYATSRYSSVGTLTNEALDTTETGVDIVVPTGKQLWGHTDGDYDIIIGGERMTVTAVSGTGPTQTLTVTRSVNGVVKSHNTGVAVQLFDEAHYALV